MDDQEAIFATLERLGLPYRLLEHAPVRGMEDCARIAEPMGAVYPKNLFLAPRSGRSQYLLLLRPFVRFDASKVSKQAGSPRLQFAGDDALFALLRAQPGAITPLGLCLPGAGPGGRRVGDSAPIPSCRTAPWCWTRGTFSIASCPP